MLSVYHPFPPATDSVYSPVHYDHRNFARHASDRRRRFHRWTEYTARSCVPSKTCHEPDDTYNVRGDDQFSKDSTAILDNQWMKIHKFQTNDAIHKYVPMNLVNNQKSGAICIET